MTRLLIVDDELKIREVVKVYSLTVFIIAWYHIKCKYFLQLFIVLII